MEHNVGNKLWTLTLERKHSWLLTVCHPDEVVDWPGVALDEKRSILADSASDINALEAAPQLRQIDSGAIVRVNDILDALRRLGRPAIQIHHCMSETCRNGRAD